ncbi:MAG: response regulator transcription factor [Kiritimatiellia bacterium]
MKASQQPRESRNKVLIVDDHPLLREGLGKIINQQDDLILCGEAGDAAGGLSAVTKCKPDVVIVDISLEQGNGLDLIKNIHALYPRLPILVLSLHHENLYALRALRAGANGYVMKREPATTLIQSLRKVLKGQTAVSENIVNQLVNRNGRNEPAAPDSPAEQLSDRELEIYRCLGEGHGTREIAGKLHIAVSTVESYRASIKQKLALADATELVSSAARFVAAEQENRTGAKRG